MTARIVNQSRQADDFLSATPIILFIPPLGRAFVTNPAMAPLERDTEGFAAAMGMFISAVAAPFSLVIHQYYTPGLLVPRSLDNSLPEPVAGIERVDFTKSITGKYIAFEIVNPNAFAILVIGTIRLRPVSCYDMENISVVFDPSDILTIRFQKGGTIQHYNGNSGGVNTPMFPANANRIEVIGINLGPRAITIAFGVPAVFGAGQTVPANTPFRFDRESGLALNFIDDGGAGGAVVSATETGLP